MKVLALSEGHVPAWGWDGMGEAASGWCKIVTDSQEVVHLSVFLLARTSIWWISICLIYLAECL